MPRAAASRNRTPAARWPFAVSGGGKFKSIKNGSNETLHVFYVIKRNTTLRPRTKVAGLEAIKEAPKQKEAWLDTFNVFKRGSIVPNLLDTGVLICAREEEGGLFFVRHLANI